MRPGPNVAVCEAESIDMLSSRVRAIWIPAVDENPGFVL